MDAFIEKMAGQPGFFKPNGHHKKKKRRPYRRQMQHGVRLAALRALTAAELLLRKEFRSEAEAAWRCGSTRGYVSAALAIIQSENTTIRKQVLRGEISLLAAARQLRRPARIVAAYRAGSESDRAMFGRVVGPATLFDGAVAPAL
jgi:hypothetical protein